MMTGSECQDTVGQRFRSIDGVSVNSRSSDRCRVHAKEYGSLHLMFLSCCRHSLLQLSMCSSINFSSELNITNVSLVSSGLSVSPILPL